MTQDVTGLNASSLYGRTFQITVGTLDVSTLRCTFNVKKSLKPREPNTASLTIYNLNAGERAYLQSIVGSSAGASSTGVAACSIQAGYLGPGNSQIYLGQIRTANSTTQGPDIVTELSTGDGEPSPGKVRLNTAFGARTPPGQALQQICAALGVGPGNVAQAVSALQASGIASICSRKAVSGSASYQLTKFCQAAGLEWSIQDGVLQVLSLGAALAGTAVVLSSSSGLVGSPTIDNQGIVTCQALMIPGLAPGRLMTINAKNLQGTYRITQCEWSGDTAYNGQEWYCNLTGKKYA